MHMHYSESYLNDVISFLEFPRGFISSLFEQTRCKLIIFITKKDINQLIWLIFYLVNA